MKYQLNIDRLIRILFSIVCLLVLVHIVALMVKANVEPGRFSRVINLVHINGEKNVPTLFSVMLLITNALLLFAIGLATRFLKLRDWVHWLALAGIFAFLSLDEFATIHELIGVKIHKTLDTTGFLMWAWVIPYSVLALAVFLMYSKFLFRLPAQTRKLFLFSGGLYVFGALGLEMVQSQIWYDTAGEGTLGRMLVLTTLEEVCEMSGQILFMGALLKYIQSQFEPHITLRSSS